MNRKCRPQSTESKQKFTLNETRFGPAEQVALSEAKSKYLRAGRGRPPGVASTAGLTAWLPNKSRHYASEKTKQMKHEILLVFCHVSLASSTIKVTPTNGFSLSLCKFCPIFAPDESPQGGGARFGSLRCDTFANLPI